MKRNILSEGKGTIKEIKQELLVLEEYKEKERNALSLEMKYEKEIRQKEKQVEDEISSTTRKRRNDIESTYDGQINKGKSQLKKVNARREKSKDEKMSERIKEETLSYVSENRLINADIRSLMKKDRIPFVCKYNLYYSIYYPAGPLDLVKMAVAALIVFVVLPALIILITPWSEGTFLKILAYVVDILLFGTIYIVVKNTFNSWHETALKQIRTKKNLINHNKKEIRRIKKGIRKDKDESRYNLGKYDKELDEINENINDLVKKKKDALGTFENSTKNIIENEITERHEKELNKLKEAHAKAKKDADRLDDVVSKMTLDISTKYDAYIGKELLKPDKLDALIEIIDKGEAKNISEAIAVYKSRYTI